MSEQQPVQTTNEAAVVPEVKVDVSTPAAPVAPVQPAKDAPLESGNEPAKEVPPAVKEGEAKPGLSKEDLVLPEDSSLDESAVERIAAEATKLGLTKQQAQEILDRESGAVTNFAKAQAEHMKAQQDSWKSLTEKDKEIGGDNYLKNVEMAKRVVHRYGTEDFIKAINETGVGNHPELVRVFYRIGKAMSEDQLVMPGSQPAPQARSTADLLYGNNNKQN